MANVASGILKKLDSVREFVGEKRIWGPEEWKKIGAEISGKIPEFPFDMKILSSTCPFSSSKKEGEREIFGEEHFFFLGNPCCQGKNLTIVNFLDMVWEKEGNFVPASFEYEEYIFAATHRCELRWHALYLKYRYFLNRTWNDQNQMVNSVGCYRIPLAVTGVMGFVLSFLKGNNIPDNLIFRCRDKVNGAGTEQTPALGFSNGKFLITLKNEMEMSPNISAIAVRFR